MNAIAFGIKRVFHGFLRVTRKALISLGLTAARFDMMHVLLDNHREFGRRGILQSDVRRALGVTAGVVSRMLHSLEVLGLVTRERPQRDKRQRWVSLTAKGIECARRARRVLLRGVQRIVYDAICFGRQRDATQRFIHMSKLEDYLQVLRRHFGDSATLFFLWGHPDD